MRIINLPLGRRFSDALERRNSIDRVELLDDFRIDIIAPERGQALFGQLGIVTDIAEQLLAQRSDRWTHFIDLAVEDMTGHAVSEHAAQQVLFVERCVHQGRRDGRCIE